MIDFVSARAMGMNDPATCLSVSSKFSEPGGS